MFENVTDILGIDPILLSALGAAIYIATQVVKSLWSKFSNYSLLVATTIAVAFALLVVLEMTKTLQVVLLTQLLVAGGAGIYSMKKSTENVSVTIPDYSDEK
jgi:hypothetical protein